MKLFIFPEPLDAACVLSHDSGTILQGQPDTHPTGRPGQSFDVSALPDGNGAQLEISAEGKVPLRQRGILLKSNPVFAGTASFLADDFRLANGAGRFL